MYFLSFTWSIENTAKKGKQTHLRLQKYWSNSRLLSIFNEILQICGFKYELQFLSQNLHPIKAFMISIVLYVYSMYRIYWAIF